MVALSTRSPRSTTLLGETAYTSVSTRGSPSTNRAPPPRPRDVESTGFPEIVVSLRVGEADCAAGSAQKPVEVPRQRPGAPVADDQCGGHAGRRARRKDVLESALLDADAETTMLHHAVTQTQVGPRQGPRRGCRDFSRPAPTPPWSTTTAASRARRSSVPEEPREVLPRFAVRRREGIRHQLQEAGEPRAGGGSREAPA